MPRRRRSLPLLAVAALAAVLLVSSLTLFSPTNPLPTPLAPRRTSTTATATLPTSFTFTLKVLAFDRVDSLARCLRSLSSANYGGDRVDLHVFVDHFGSPGGAENGSSSLLDRKLREAHRLLEFVDGFVWGHGRKVVHYRTGNAGLQAQWLEAWWPGSDDEFAFVVEDDLEVSPFYYRFLKGLIARYYYDPSNSSPLIYGASLQRPRFVPEDGSQCRQHSVKERTKMIIYGKW